MASGLCQGPPHCPRASELTQEAEPQTVLLSSDWIFLFLQPNPAVSGRGFGWELQMHPFLWRGWASGLGPRKREWRVKTPHRSKPQVLTVLSLPLSSFLGVPTGPSKGKNQCHPSWMWFPKEPTLLRVGPRHHMSGPDPRPAKSEPRR